MNMRLVICEKPSVMRELAPYFGKVTGKGPFHVEVDEGRTIVACNRGHIIEQEDADAYLPPPGPGEANKKGKRRWMASDLPVIPDRWKFRAVPDEQARLKALIAFIKQASEIVNAGDAAREGQLITDEVLMAAGVDPDAPHIKRLWLLANDEASIRKALGALRMNSEFKGLREAARARSEADWLVGINGTRAYTISTGALVSVGRVQTPVLYLVYLRELAIRNFKPTDYFVPWILLNDGSETGLKLTWSVSEREQRPGLFDEEGRIISRELAEKIAADAKKAAWEVTEAEIKDVKQNPPLTHSLSSLSSEMSRQMKMSAKETLEHAQALYDGGYASYPRTGCRHMPESMLGERGAVLAGLRTLFPKEAAGADMAIHGAAFNDKKITEDHYAIIPTGVVPTGLDDRRKRVYDVIARTYIGQSYPPAIYRQTTVEMEFGALDTFRSGTKVLVSPGWRTVIGDVDPDDDLDSDKPGPKAKLSGPQQKK